MRARGLKLLTAAPAGYCRRSRPMRARGLKRFLVSQVFRKCVAPHAGAWIETSYNLSPLPAASVAPHAGAWIETNNLQQFDNLRCRAPCGRVD